MSQLAVEQYIAERIRQEKEQELEDLALIESGLKAGNLSVVSYALDVGLTDEVPKILYRLWQESVVPPDRLEFAIYEVWVHNKSPVHGVTGDGLGERAWLRLFKAAGFIGVFTELYHRVDGQRVQVEPAYPPLQEQPTEPFTVWRGAQLSKGRGMSWSIHRDCAVGFADSWAAVYHSPTGVFRATLPAKAALAVFGDEREQEVVVNPNMLRGRIVLEETRQPPPLSQEQIDLRAAFGRPVPR
jgi:hypothetical protein